jgi:hypothetical protein
MQSSTVTRAIGAALLCLELVLWKQAVAIPLLEEFQALLSWFGRKPLLRNNKRRQPAVFLRRQWRDCGKAAGPLTFQVRFSLSILWAAFCAR